MYKKLTYIIIISCIFLFNTQNTFATSAGLISGNGVRFRKTPNVDNSNIIKELSMGTSVTLVSDTLYPGTGCNAGWYNVTLNGTSGYVCSSYVTFGTTNNTSTDVYGRPWTSPKKAIEGGALFIAKSYISKGQFTSYLKKFNVNPNSSYSLYNHQYMANLQAPYSEAYTSFKSYRDNGLLSLPLEFTIPIFNGMPGYTALPETSANTSCQAEVTDANFEALLDAQGFPESYKCKLRLLHNSYPNWTFKALNTNLDFSTSVWKEQIVSSIQGGGKYYYVNESGNYVQTENGWYKANTATVSFYLDPRNFLVPERILMFENLGYSTNYTESVVSSTLKGTFMEGYSLLDNQTYASIFVEAGRKAGMSAVYLASLAKQESGNNGSRATSGAQFTYNNVTYSGLFNFFNIGAYSSEASPILAGLVWASAGSDSSVVDKSTGSNEEESSYLETLKAKIRSGCMTDIKIGTKASYFVIGYNNVSTSVKDVNGNEISGDSIVKTGATVTIKDSINTFSYVISINADVNGDGVMSAADYVEIKKYIMSENKLSTAQSIAADVDENGSIGASDYVTIKNRIMKAS